MKRFLVGCLLVLAGCSSKPLTRGIGELDLPEDAQNKVFELIPKDFPRGRVSDCIADRYSPKVLCVVKGVSARDLEQEDLATKRYMSSLGRELLLWDHFPTEGDATYVRMQKAWWESVGAIFLGGIALSL